MTASNGVSAPWQGKRSSYPAQGRSDPKRERTIARLALLKAAATFAATRQDIKSGDVLTIAKSWERWILEA